MTITQAGMVRDKDKKEMGQQEHQNRAGGGAAEHKFGVCGSAPKHQGGSSRMEAREEPVVSGARVELGSRDAQRFPS